MLDCTNLTYLCLELIFVMKPNPTLLFFFTVYSKDCLGCILTSHFMASCFLPQVLWTRLPCENFHLLIACSILESQREELIGSNHDFNTILKVCVWIKDEFVCFSVIIQIFIFYNVFHLQHINELTMKLDLQSVLRGAEAIYLQLFLCKVRHRATSYLMIRHTASKISVGPNLRLLFFY